MWKYNAILLVIMGAALAAAIYIGGSFTALRTRWDPEALKIGMQFFLVTALGGGLAALFSARKDAEARREAHKDIVRQIDKDLDNAYRSVKTVKRRLRTRNVSSDLEIKEIPSDDFIQLIDDLEEAQIAVEKVRDDISRRRDLIGHGRSARIAAVLRYAARQLHDAIADVEKQHVRELPGMPSKFFIIDEKSPALLDFIVGRDMPPEKGALQQMGDREAPLHDRFAAFDTIENARKKSKPNDRRYAVVSRICYDLASAELRNVVTPMALGTHIKMVGSDGLV